jgi:shikimate kinase
VSTANPNLYLVGFMGVGKTTVGRAIAHKLGYLMLDSDHEIERKAGKPITDIFAEDGEAAFRVMEREFIENGHPSTACVVACGGGLIVQPGIPELVRSKGIVICLHASIETILQRTSSARHRPLLNVEDQETRIRTLFAERDPIYRQIGSTILTDARPLHEIAAHVLRTYKRDAADWNRSHEARSQMPEAGGQKPEASQKQESGNQNGSRKSEVGD